FANALDLLICRAFAKDFGQKSLGFGVVQPCGNSLDSLDALIGVIELHIEIVAGKINGVLSICRHDVVKRWLGHRCSNVYQTHQIHAGLTLQSASATPARRSRRTAQYAVLRQSPWPPPLQSVRGHAPDRVRS